jgi:hypothetical protein
MRIRVVAHGLLTVAVQDPGGAIELTVPDGSDIQHVLWVLHDRSPVFDPRATPVAVIDGAQVPLNQVLHAGEEVHLYPIFGGG